MNHTFKTEIDPTSAQIKIIEENMLVVRHAFNLYLNLNLNRVEQGEKQFGAERFLRWFYTRYLKRPDNAARFPRKFNRHAVEKSVRNAAAVTRDYAQQLIGRPCCKKSYLDNVKLFYSGSRIDEFAIKCDGEHIRLSGIGWIRLKEKGYCPKDSEGRYISAYLSKKADRYYVSVTVDLPKKPQPSAEKSEALDLSIGKIETEKIAALNRKIRRENRKLRKKYAFARAEGRKTGKNIQKQKKKIYKLKVRRDNARKDCINKSISYVVGLNPEYVSVHEECAFSDYGSFTSDLAIKCRRNKIVLKLG